MSEVTVHSSHELNISTGLLAGSLFQRVNILNKESLLGMPALCPEAHVNQENLKDTKALSTQIHSQLFINPCPMFKTEKFYI